MASHKIGALSVDFTLETENGLKGLKNVQAQMADMEKTIRPVTRAVDELGDALTSAGKILTVGVTAPIVAAGALAVSSFNEQAKATAIMENAIRSTGAAAGKTAEQLQGMASALQNNSLFGDEQILGKVEAQLLTFTNISGSSFDRATKAALDMSTVLGQDLQSSAIQLGKALNDPVNGMTALQRVGVRLTDDQKALVKSFVEVGDTAGAQNVILQELEKEFGGAAEAASKAGLGPFTQLKNNIDNLGESFGELILQHLNPFIKYANDVVNSMQSLSPATKDTIVVIGGLAAATGPALLGLGQLAFGFNNVVSAAVSLAGYFPGVATALQGLTIAGVASTAGIVALGAAIGVGIGSLINYGLEVTGLQKGFDKLSASIINAVVPFGTYITGQKGLNDATKLADDNTRKLSDALTKAGVSFDASRLSDAKYVSSLGDLFEKTEENRKASIDKATADLDAAEATKKHAAEVEKQAAALKAAAEEAKKLKAAIDSAVDSIIPTSFETSKLTGEIQKLEAAGVPTATIIKDVGKAAEELETKYRDAGLTIPEAQQKVISSIYLGYEAQKVVTAANKALLDQEEANHKDAAELYTKLDETWMNAQIAAYGVIEAADREYNAQVKANEKEATELYTQLDFTETDAHIEELKKRIKAEDEYANHIREIYSDITGKLRGEALTWGNLTDTFFDNWHQGALTIGNVMRDAGIKAAGYFFAPLKDEADKFFNKILGDIIDSALGPLRKRLTDFIGGILNGADGKGGIAGALGGLIPGGSGGDTGGKFNLTKTLEGGAIAGGIAAAVYGITKLIGSLGEGRKTADEFVKDYQTPFGQQFGQIVDAYTIAKQQGKATAQDAIDVSNTVATLYQQFSAAAATFAQQGDTQLKVVQQAHQTLDAMVAGFVAGSKAEASTLPASLGSGTVTSTGGDQYTGNPDEKNIRNYLALIQGGITPNSSAWDHSLDYLVNALGVPQYAGGIDLVQNRHLAVLDPGERVQTADQNPFNPANKAYGVSGGWSGAGSGGGSTDNSIHLTIYAAPNTIIDRKAITEVLLPAVANAAKNNSHVNGQRLGFAEVFRHHINALGPAVAR